MATTLLPCIFWGEIRGPLEVDSAELPSLTLPSSLSIITLFKMRGREQWGDKENICVRKLHFKRQLKTGINKSAFMEAFLHVVKHF